MVSSPDVRVDGMDGGAIYAALTGGAGPSGLTDNSSGWCTRSSGYTEVQAAIEAALNRAGATWQGRGADSAQSAVSPLGDWAAQTSAASTTASDAVNSQVDAFSTARNSVQPMAAVPSKPFWNNFVPWNTDYDSAVSHNNEVTAHNRTVLASYGSATDTHVATLPPFEPPAAVGTDFVNSPSPSPSASDAGHLGSSWDGGGSGATGAAGGGTGGGGATGADGGTTSSGSSSSGGGGGYSGGAGSSGGADSPGVPSRVGEPGQNSGGAAVSAGGGQYASGTGSPGGGVGTSGPPGSGRPEQGSPLSTPGPVGQNSDDYASGVHSAAFNPDPPGAGTYGGASAASPGGYGSAGNGYGAGSSGAGGGSGAGATSPAPSATEVLAPPAAAKSVGPPAAALRPAVGTSVQAARERRATAADEAVRPAARARWRRVASPGQVVLEPANKAAPEVALSGELAQEVRAEQGWAVWAVWAAAAGASRRTRSTTPRSSSRPWTSSATPRWSRRR